MSDQSSDQPPDQPPAATLDHLVWAAEDLDAGVRAAERRLGVRAAPGGTHPGMGTRNALLSLGPGRYLEVLAPDPAQDGLRGPVGAWVRGAGTGSLAGWAARASDLDRVAAAARAAGLAVTGPFEMSRERPGATPLAWRIAFFDDQGLPGATLGPLLPFFIDWGDSPHPSELAPAGCTLERLHGEHPDPARASAVLAALGIDLPVTAGGQPRLLATIRTPPDSDLAGSTAELS